MGIFRVLNYCEKNSKSSIAIPASEKSGFPEDLYAKTIFDSI